MNDKKHLAILIDSFDGYSDLWPIFFKIFNTFWSDCKYQRYLVSNTKEYIDDNLIMLKTGIERDWFYRTIKAVEALEEGYILFMLEDYFISKKICNDEIENIITHMQESNIYYYKLSGSYTFKIKDKNIKVSNLTHYPINLQMAVWKREEFLSILNELKNKGAKSPWDFEKYFVKKFINLDNDNIIDGIEYDTRDLFGYKNGVLQGKWIRDTIAFYNRRGIVIDTNNRETMSYRETQKMNFRRFISQRLSKKNRRFLKKILSKFGFKFMS